MPDELKYLAPNEIKTRPGFNPRTDVDVTDIVESVREHGIITPLTVAENGDGYNLIAGERRLTAAIMCDVDQVPVIVRTSRDQENPEAEELTLALLENIARNDLSAVEEARAIKRLMNLGYATVKQLSHKLSMTQKRVKSRLRILDCPDDVQDLVHENKVPLAAVDVVAPIADVDPELASHAMTYALEQGWNLHQFANSWPNSVKVSNFTPEEGTSIPTIGKWVHAHQRMPLDVLQVAFDSDEATLAKLTEIDAVYPWDYTLELADTDLDAARSYRCLLEHRPEDEFRNADIITDREWYIDHLKSTVIPRELRRARKAAKEGTAEELPQTTNGVPSIAAEAASTGRSEDEVRAERQAEREENQKAMEASDAFNRELGSQVFERLNEVQLTPKLARLLVALVLRDGAGDVARCGLTYLHPAWREDEELKNGRTKTTYIATQEEARERLSSFISQASTAEEILGRLAQVVLASELADDRVVARSRRTGRSFHAGQDGLDLASKQIEEGVAHLSAQLTPKMRKEAAQRRDERIADRRGL